MAPLTFRTAPSQDLSINDQQFANFIERHRAYAHVLCPEDNQDMRESYLMVDPYGRFFQNSPLIAGQSYAYSQPILAVGAAKAFSEMAFDPERFTSRYSNSIGGHSA